jgi:predicted CXXCH cytochrome family protein
MKSWILFAALMAGAIAPAAGTVTADEDSTTATLPDSTVHGSDFKLDCARCHTPEDWRAPRPDLDFDHAETDYTLHGRHAELECRACHEDLVFHRIGVLCADCHADVVHRGELGYDCARCHNERDWRQSANLLLEHQQTRFPLLGRHALVDCDACHRTAQKNEFVGQPTDCRLCHANDYVETRSPNHEAFGFSTDCESCHSVVDLWWTDVAFQHPASFPLEFGHDIADCALCHVDGQVVLDGENCYACHRADYEGTVDPQHTRYNFPALCADCHETTSFYQVGPYSHSPSGFPAFGGHMTNDCAACHISGQYAGLDRACFSCHRAEYLGTEDPDHQVVGFSTECEDCHTPVDWDVVKLSPKGRR